MASPVPPQVDEDEVPELPPPRPVSQRQLSRSRSLGDVLSGVDEEPAAALLRQTLAAFLRGGAAGLLLKGGLTVANVALSLVTRRRGPRKVAVLRHEAVGALRVALFLATYASGCRLTEGLLKARFGSRSDSWRAALAGAVAAPSLLLASSQPSPSLSIYIALRAALLALRAEAVRAKERKDGGWPSTRVGRLLQTHGPLLTMCGTASVLLHAWVYVPATLDPGYVRFLDRAAGKGRGVVEAVEELSRTGGIVATLPAVRSWHAAQGARSAAAVASIAPDCSDPCQLVHPGEGHLEHALFFLLRGVVRALPVYAPVYAASTLVVRRGAVLKKPGRVLGRAALGILRSSLFLSTYCTIAWASFCTLSRRRRPSRATVLACSFPAGLAALIEKPSRRTELALFCSGHALHSLARLAVLWGWVHPVGREDLLLFCCSSAVIMDAYERRPETFRPSFRSVFDWVSGRSWRRKGSYLSLLW